MLKFLNGFDSLVEQCRKAKPFVKWAGGKGQLLGQLAQLLPAELANRAWFDYREPFVGGGAMLFFMLSHFPNIRKAVINDLNKDLIITYKAIRDTPEELIECLSDQQTKYRECSSEEARKLFYLHERNRFNAREASDVEMATLFIFLNRTCFNGLYRVNSKGLYNVPFGKTSNPLICDADTIRADSELLQKVEILNGDFESTVDNAAPGTFFYFDPPYRPLTETASFTAYAKNGFDDAEQKRLADFCRQLHENGHQWLLSNSDPHNSNPGDNFFEDIYSGFAIQRVSASRMINSKADGRGKITELAIRNYQE